MINYIENEAEIPWKRVYEVPDHVYFSHRRHVIIGELSCELCHGKVEDQNQPIASQYLETSMDNCMNCHEEYGTTNDCLACHY